VEGHRPLPALLRSATLPQLTLGEGQGSGAACPRVGLGGV